LNKIILSDVYNIAKRLKEIDQNYFVVYNTSKYKYEVHNSRQIGDSYCLTVPFDCLDARTIVLVQQSRIKNISEMVEKMDFENAVLQKINNKTALDDLMCKTENNIRNSTK